MGSEDVGVVGGGCWKGGDLEDALCSAWDRMPTRVPNGLQNSLARPEGKAPPENSFILFVYFWLGWVLVAAWAFSRCRILTVVAFLAVAHGLQNLEALFVVV